MIKINRDKTITDTPVKRKRGKTRYIFQKCTIQGNVDYIFGGGSALFVECIINSIYSDEGESYICAPCTSHLRAYGFVFYHCKINCDDSQQNNYLGRPWREFAKAYFINCDMSANLLENGWHYWGDDPASVQKADFRAYQANTKLIDQYWAISSKNIPTELIASLQRYFNINL
ncbi:hypothetical protein H5S09_02160 [Limosilactobacillus sp. STM2_1]|uniref:Pectinesterase catalytic domain-containing protein n=1 Tax=Limosilactobacillus rudii TaxID=2759755 RepID=A0A7W3UJK1_9LACO|nr:pectinesterase family protein [Limosilactobacillus rudii]MBB1078671.1 hypothetical protein [Limosilactobacillus rudii]MBB1096761.1 hypothetical protein [Limosilactobacillus rudii]MCD7135567.1 pectinesterase family protein [Limosilactobacillus rudii]